VLKKYLSLLRLIPFASSAERLVSEKNKVPFICSVVISSVIVISVIVFAGFTRYRIAGYGQARHKCIHNGKSTFK
jgi:hypothetical protein